MLGRSALLLAMMACLPETQQAARVSDDVEDLLRRFWTLCPDLASPETRAAIFEDLKARCRVGGRSLSGACSELGAQLDRWANGGREPVLVYDEPTGVGDWRGRVLLQAPGQYIAEVRREGGEDRTVHAQGGLPTAVAASEETVSWARRLQLGLDAAHLNRALGLGAEEAERAASGWLWLKEAMTREAGQLARENSVLVGVDEAGPVSPSETLTADEFTARYGIRDDLMTEPPSPEQRAKMEAWHDEVTSREGARLALGKPPRVWRSLSMTKPGDTLTAADIRRAAAEMENNAIPKDADGMYRLAGATDFARAQRMAMNPSREAGPVDFKRAGELNRIRRRPLYAATPEQRAEALRVDALLHPAGRCTCGGERTCEWCEMDRRRELREERRTAGAAKVKRCRVAPMTGPGRVDGQPADALPGDMLFCSRCGWLARDGEHARVLQREAKRARAARKARRGWA